MTPAAKDIYSWSNYTPLGRVKVVIIGQDPYFGPKQAHGTFHLILQNPFISLPFLPPLLPREGGGLGSVISAADFSPTASD